VYSSLGRIEHYLLIVLLCAFAYPLSAGEVRAVQLEKEANHFERQSRIELDPDKQKYLKDLAKVRREDAALERKRHFKSETPVSIIGDGMNGKNLKTFQTSSNTFEGGTIELTSTVGAGSFSSTAGSELLGFASQVGVTDSRTFLRNRLSYDNIPYYNNLGSASRYAIQPIGLKLRYTNNEDKYGFQFDIRSFNKDTSFISWDYFTNDLANNTFQDSSYFWSDAKINYFYLEEFAYNQSIEFIFGLRNQSSLIKEKASLPYSGRYREYNESANYFGPNLGFAYKKNFYGVFIFTAGIELSALGGALDYNSLELRSQSPLLDQNIASFSKIDMEKPIFLSMSVIELYAKYDFLIGERNRIGIGLTSIQSYRTSNWDQDLPTIISSNQAQLVEDYKNFIIRNILYNQESQNLGGRNMNIQYIQLELTHVF